MILVPSRPACGIGLAIAVTIGLAIAASGCGDGAGDETALPNEAIEHVHGLGINPADRSLFIAAHGGLFRSSDESAGVHRVGESTQDTMGFAVVGPDHFLGSGHPGPGEAGPASLGLIESTDGGDSWRRVSLSGEADFHVLRYAHDRIYAVNALTGLFMLSEDGGRDWEERRPPAPIIDLAVDPGDPRRIIVATEAGLAISNDDGEHWRRLSEDIGLLAWPERDRLYLVAADGDVQVSSVAGKKWQLVGSIGGQPAALMAAGVDELLAALADGTVLISDDGGQSWTERAMP